MSLIFICISPFLVLGIGVVFFLIFKKIIRRDKELVKVINQAPNKEFAYNKIAKLSKIETNTQNTNNLNIRILNFLENEERFRDIIKADSILEIFPNDYENFVDAVSQRAELNIPSNINKQELFKIMFDYVYKIDFKESLKTGGINIYKQLTKKAGSRSTFVLDFFPYFRLEQLGNVTLFYLLCYFV